MLRAEDFFDLKNHPLASLFEGTDFVWEALKEVRGYIEDHLDSNVKEIRRISGEVVSKTVVLYNGEIIDEGFSINSWEAAKGSLEVERKGEILKGASVVCAGAILMDDRIFIGRGTCIEPGAMIRGPAIIGNYTEVRQGAYVRGDVIVGERCVVGHTTEIKHSVMLGESKAGHFAYIGDSIIGKANLGAGTKLANLKLNESEVTVVAGKKLYRTGLKKFGAIIGDGVGIGCNVVTNPGTLLGRGTLVAPNTSPAGYYAPRSVVRGEKLR